ncbi:MAG: NnrU family protein [Gammaproteobacteria bacterium]|nr:NnrU family protein [Gammaproteobacteria bacterium]
MNLTDYILYALLWLSFGFAHSLLASNLSKRILQPIFGPAYRLVYNLFSALHIGLIMIGGSMWLGDNAVSFNLDRWLDILIMACRWLGVGIMAAALTQYDLGLFGGLTQLRRGSDSTDEDEPLHLSGMHRYVRHPIYLGAYCYLWGGAVNEFGLQTALWGSTYLLIGTWFEERKLIAQYGQSYVDYRIRVPSVIPFRGRAI